MVCWRKSSKKVRFSFSMRGGDLELLRRGRVGESPAEAVAAHRVCLFKALAIGEFVTAIMARKLAIDVGYDSGLRGAGKIIGRNDLIA